LAELDGGVGRKGGPEDRIYDSHEIKVNLWQAFLLPSGSKSSDLVTVTTKVAFSLPVSHIRTGLGGDVEIVWRLDN
jgi:hypothetical protein